MRIIVLSDTHGNPKVLETILARHADADACIHLGDSEGDVKLFLSCHPEWESKFYAVRGNCDFNSSLPISRTIDLIPGHRIFAVHGHRHAISYTPDILVEEAWKIGGVLGSRMMGAGFGGCTVSIVENSAVNDFISKVGGNYYAQTGLKAEFYVVETGNGATVL